MSQLCQTCGKRPFNGTDLLCDDCRATERAAAKLKSWAPVDENASNSGSVDPGSNQQDKKSVSVFQLPGRPYRIKVRATGLTLLVPPHGEAKPTALHGTRFTKDEALEVVRRLKLTNETHEITTK